MTQWLALKGRIKLAGALWDALPMPSWGVRLPPKTRLHETQSGKTGLRLAASVNGRWSWMRRSHLNQTTCKG